jgi:ADP-ribose pyrophosphatase YjhB (NUDIX family)
MSAQVPPSFTDRVPAGDDRPRRVCDTCGFVDYVNPKIVVGAVVTDGDERILLCRRAIQPRRGYWTLPAGYMEEGESVAAAAAREAREEALAELEIGPLLALYDIPRLSQVQIFFRARLLNPEGVGAGPESLNVALFTWDRIPWTALAFTTVSWALNHWRESRALDAFPPYRNP